MTKRSDEGTAPTVTPELAPTVRPGDSTKATQFSDPALPISDGLADTADAPLAGKLDALAIVERSHYDVLGEFGRGGLGRVLRARDRRTGRIVAIKEVLRASPSLLARFAREAVVTANLQHPAIVPVYEVGRWPSGEPFYAMKLVAGKSLLDAATAKKTLRERVELLPHVTAVADALAYAHGERVIHRDLKPANVLIGDYGETVVIDWGLAKRLGDADDLALAPAEDALVEGGKTAAGVVMGTPGYMAPEQARGEPADARSDVYAIGAMLYEVLAGVRPYHETPTPDEVIRLATERPPRALAEIDPEIPGELVAIVERAMAFAPADRYRDAKQLADDLKRYQTGQLVGAHQYSPWQLLARFVRRHLAAVVATAIGVVALSAVGTYGVVRVRRERDTAVAAQVLAEDRLAALFEEQGRELTVSGDPARGLPYLARAVALGRHSPALEFLVARALEPIANVDAVVTVSPKPLDGVQYARDGATVITWGQDWHLRVWNPRTHALVSDFGPAFNATPSADGAQIAVAADDSGAAQLRDLRTGDIVRAMTGKLEDLPSAIALSPRGDHLALAGQHGAVAWWDTATGARTQIAPRKVDPVFAIAFSPDGSRLAIAPFDGHARVLRVADAGVAAELTQEVPVLSVAWSPDGTRVATAAQNGVTTVWNAATAAKLLELRHGDSVQSVAFDRTGARVLTGSRDGTAALWDSATGVRLVTFAVGHHVLEAVFAPDDKTIATRDEHGDIKLFAANGRALATLSGHLGSATAVAFSPTGAQLASAGVDGDLRFWSVAATPSSIALDNAGTVSWQGGFSPDDKLVAISGADGVARVYDGSTGERTRELRHPTKVTAVDFSRDGSRLATACEDGVARIWNLATGDLVFELRGGTERVRFVQYSPDGALIATTQPDAARIWRADGTLAATFTPEKGVPRQVLWSPDGSRVLVTLDRLGAAILASDGKLLGTATMPIEYVTAATWLPDGRSFALGGSNTPEFASFDGTTGARIGEAPGHAFAPLFSLDASPDNRNVVSAANDGTARIWHGTVELYSLGDRSSKMLQAVYRNDSALVATGNGDGMVQVWDARNGAEVGRLAASSGVGRLRWSHDGTRLLGLTDGAPMLWHVSAWHGEASELAARLRCALHYQLVETTLVRAKPDPTACAK